MLSILHLLLKMVYIFSLTKFEATPNAFEEKTYVPFAETNITMCSLKNNCSLKKILAVSKFKKIK